MVNDFLRKYQEELISEKIQLKEDIDLLDTKIKEESKFLDLLESSNDSYFQEFTPHIVNKKNNEKADEIRSILETLNADMNVKTEKMKFYDSRLVELSALLNNTAVINRPNSEKTDAVSNNENEKYSHLKNALLDIKNTILLDPYKASIELDKVISSL